MECIDAIVSSETFVSDEYLRYGHHTGLFHEFVHDFGRAGDVYLFERDIQVLEKVFCHHTVGAGIFGIDGYHILWGLHDKMSEEYMEISHIYKRNSVWNNGDIFLLIFLELSV